MRYVIISILTVIVLCAQKEAVKTHETIIIDGILEKEWEIGTKIDQFKQFTPKLFGTERYKTEISILYDSEYLYIGARVWQPKSELVTKRYRRDSFKTWESDFIQIMFSTNESSVNAYFITINPSNSKNDGIFNEQTEENLNLDMNSISETSIFEDRWELEVKIPLNELDYQSESDQRWKFSAIRHFALYSERVVSHNYKKDNIFEINTFEPISGFKISNKRKRFSALVYQQYQYQKNKLLDLNSENDNRGYNISYQPNGASRLLLTLNPDFAQLESDEPVINVGDEPTNYPEKRPFFTQSTGMYSNETTIYTRNISSIDLGVKWIHEVEQMKYDITVIQDKASNRWLLSDMIYTDDNSYRYELVNGLKKDEYGTSHTSRLNIERYFLNKRFKLINHVEYTDQKEAGFGNTFNAIYQTRHWLLKYENEIRSKEYNPGDIGFKEVSNKLNNSFQLKYSMFFDNSWVLLLKPEINFEDFGLYEGSKQRSRMFDLKLHSVFRVGSLGVWYLGARYQPEISQSFRHRNIFGKNKDNYSKFDIKDSRSDKFVGWMGTDKSKLLAFDIEFGHSSVRAGRSHFQTFATFINLHQNLGLSYKFDRINIEKSVYQTKLIAVTHRVKLDYNLTDKMNLRTIYNFSKDELPILKLNNNLVGLVEKTPNFNVTFSWEYSPGSFVYLMYNDFKTKEKVSNYDYERLADTQTFMLKINKLFTF